MDRIWTEHRQNMDRILIRNIGMLQLEKQEVAASLQKEERIPGCFHQKTCHIKQFCKNKTYTSKTIIICECCVWFKSTAWTGTLNFI